MSPDVVTDIAVEEIGSVEALEAVRPEWAALWSKCPSATPFQHPAWLLAWWRYFGGGPLVTLTVRQDGRLVGLAPLFVWHRPDTKERTVLLVGTGITDHLDALFEPGFEQDGVAALFDYLDAERHRWDVCQFEQLGEGSPLLTHAEPPGWASEVTRQDACPVLSWRNDAQALEDVVPASLVKKLRYYDRRTRKEGDVTIERAVPDTLGRCFDDLLRLHRARWTSVGEAGVLAGDRVQQFHREAAEGLLEAGMLRLYVMHLNGEAVAAYYGVAAHGCAYYYLSGFDPAYPVLSLGTQIVGYAIEQVIHEGGTAFDFLRGREDYKYAWGAKDRQNYQRRLAGIDEGFGLRNDMSG